MAAEAGVEPRRLPRLPLVLAASLGVAVAVTAVAVWAGGGAAVQVPGIPDAGALTAWGLPVARTVVDASAVATVGALLLVVVLLPGGRKLGPARLRYLTWAAVAAGVWAAASVATLVLTLSDLFARPVGEVASAAVVADFVTTDAQGRSYALMAAAAGVVVTLCTGIGTAWWARLALLVALVGMLPPAFSGHSSAAGNHDTAVTSLALHLAGVAVWVGGLVFVLVAAARRESDAATAAGRFSPLAGWALIAVAASGIVNAAVRLPSAGEVFTSRYGLMVLAKTVALAMLGGIGWWHRRRTLPALDDGRRRAFVRLAAGELLLIAAAMGLAVGLARTPAPGVGNAELSPTEELLGLSMPPPLGDFPWTPLFTRWHFDPLFAFGTAAAALLYLAGVRKLRARGDKWPVGRTISWLAGLAVTVLATMSGLNVYGKVLFSVHMGQHMILAMTVPILLVLGAPATLALRALPATPQGEPDGPRKLLTKLLQPLRQDHLQPGGGERAVHRQRLRRLLHLAVRDADAQPPRAHVHAGVLPGRGVAVLRGGHRHRPGPAPPAAPGPAVRADPDDALPLLVQHLADELHRADRRGLVVAAGPAVGRAGDGRPVRRRRDRLGQR